jgi:hypothetical protein
MTWSQNFNMLQHFMTTTMCDSSETLVCLKMRYPTAIDKSPGIERWEYLIFRIRQTHILNCRPWRDFPARWMKRPSSMMVWKRWRSTLRIAHGAFPWRLGSSWTEMEPVIPEGTFAYKCAKDEDVCWWFSEGNYTCSTSTLVYPLSKSNKTFTLGFKQRPTDPNGFGQWPTGTSLLCSRPWPGSCLMCPSFTKTGNHNREVRSPWYHQLDNHKIQILYTQQCLLVFLRICIYIYTTYRHMTYNHKT